jgi:hypothetical protein
MSDVWEMSAPTYTVRGGHDDVWYEIEHSEDPPEWARGEADRLLETWVDEGVCGRCRRGVIGLILVDNDDTPSQNGTRWLTPWIIRDVSGRVTVVCEDCVSGESL